MIGVKFKRFTPFYIRGNMDRFEISMLRSYYGALLTETQNEYLRLHYDEDMSYGEIAEIYSVSRQAILDAINKGVKLLEGFEEKLGFIKRDRQILGILKKVDTDDEKIKDSIEEIKKIMED
ncbi:MAG: DNA-binding protein [Clostridia bacterium]|nr:DNA-binding protein [Clostridia bacterium]